MTDAAEPAPTFAEVTALDPLDGSPQSGTAYRMDVHPDWSIGGKPNGGYLLAALARAATNVVDQDHAIAASAHFLRSPDFGPAVVTAEVLRAGRSASQVRARLVQDDEPRVEALITVGRLDPGATPYWADGLPDPRRDGAGVHPEGFEAAVPLGGPTPSGVEVPLLGQVDLRLDPASLAFGAGTPTGAGELWGWLALPHGEAFDPPSLVFALDAFPPATFDIEMSGWVPTLELTAYVRALPAPGPVRVLQKARLIDGQRVDEACFAWDSTGRLVAQATQLAGIRLG